MIFSLNKCWDIILQYLFLIYTIKWKCMAHMWQALCLKLYSYGTSYNAESCHVINIFNFILYYYSVLIIYESLVWSVANRAKWFLYKYTFYSHYVRLLGYMLIFTYTHTRARAHTYTHTRAQTNKHTNTYKHTQARTTFASYNIVNI